MSAIVTKHDGTTAVITMPGVGIIFAAGDTVPTGAGYAPGCYFAHVDGTANSAAYINEGTSTSASFVEVGAA